MTSLTLLKCDYSRALEKCVTDCQRLIQTHKHSVGMEICVDTCQQFLKSCIACIASCESASLDRGKTMFLCLEACERCRQECEKHSYSECERCLQSCIICMEEFEHVMA